MTEFYARISTELDGSWRWEVYRRGRSWPWQALYWGNALTKDQAIQAARSAKRTLEFQPQVLEIDL